MSQNGEFYLLTVTFLKLSGLVPLWLIVYLKKQTQFSNGQNGRKYL
jgi:hypothetical protein